MHPNDKLTHHHPHGKLAHHAIDQRLYFKPTEKEALLSCFHELEKKGCVATMHFDGSHYVVEFQHGYEKDFGEAMPEKQSRLNDTLLMLTHDGIGLEGSQLSKTLMAHYLKALADKEPYPKAIVMMHKGVLLAHESSHCLEPLRVLEAKGVLVLSNCTCLETHKAMEGLAVGGVTNMYNIVELTKMIKNTITL